ncbi:MULTISPECIES: response regulator [unclassified Shimia]|uniref:response regulator n=1 Tax=unclassified Shimia TaxID=2630038 RepID=UPI00310A3192
MKEFEKIGANLKVLAVDDEPMNVKILQKMLRHCGLDCEIARDGVEAVEMALNHDYDVILMDINMPRMDGVAAAQEIAKHLNPAGPQVIAVTANATSEMEQECAQAGFSGFIPKPVRLDQLRAVLAAA